MTVIHRPYTSDPRFGADFLRVKAFLASINQPEMVFPGFPWARWEWAFSLPYLDRQHLDRIMVWEDDGEIVALATYESRLGEAFVAIAPTYSHLTAEVVAVATDRLADAEGRVRMYVPDRDPILQDVTYAAGFRPTADRDWNSWLPIASTTLDTNVPPGYRLATLAEEPDPIQYGKVLWKGFNHEAKEGPYNPTDQTLRDIAHQRSGPGYDPDLNMVAIAPNGEFAAHCGIWHAAGETYAVIEPVATVPEHRRKGLGRAVVHAAIERAATRGATEAWVGSTLPLYLAIGFRPWGADTWWERPGI
jgi:predicted N-acetyltransferase YhbS